MFQKMKHLLILLGCFFFWTHSKEVSIPFHISQVIHVIEEIENKLLVSSAVKITELLRKIGKQDNAYYQHLLGDVLVSDAELSFLTKEQTEFLKYVMQHEVKSTSEYGVVLTRDGTSVATSPLILGLAAGLKRQTNMPLSVINQDLAGTVDNILSATLTKDLGLSYLLSHINQSTAALGSHGCWNNISYPNVFTLLEVSPSFTDAFVNGGFDGVILGNYLSENKDHALKISSVMREYYNENGQTGQAQLKSNFRQQNFAHFIRNYDMREQVKNSLYLYKHLSQDPVFQPSDNNIIDLISEKDMEEFQRVYLECPAIIPRCMWEAKPFIGTPTPLKLPLGFVYIHHTYEPSKPCRTFPECAADMRSMQRFHQEDRGWQDIGYNFVVGSDGYLYEGRGWLIQGAHTKGNNEKGYGVSFIGDYTSALPESFALELVKESFLKCAVKGLNIVSNFTIHGHRQLVNTSCPGEKLYQLIKTWPGFKEVH